MACIIQTICVSFKVVQTIKGGLRKLKFKNCGSLMLYSRVTARCNSFFSERELDFHKLEEPIRQKCFK